MFMSAILVQIAGTSSPVSTSGDLNHCCVLTFGRDTRPAADGMPEHVPGLNPPAVGEADGVLANFEGDFLTALGRDFSWALGWVWFSGSSVT
jgi:hypothetical protein